MLPGGLGPFDKFDTGVLALSIWAMADDLLTLLLKQVFSRRGLMNLLDAGQDWSVKREEFRRAVLGRIAKTLVIYRPNLLKKSAGNMALVVLLNVKAIASHQELRDSAPDAMVEEIRDMTRLYLQSRLGSSISGKKSIRPSR